MIGLSPALYGLLHSEAQFNETALKIARAPLALLGEDSLDLSAAAVALLESRDNFEANTAMIKVADEMEKAVIDMVR
jgi:hypothetical protein